MAQSSQNAEVIRPDLVRRTGGGWLGIAPNGSPFRIGVTARTEEEAVEKFRYIFNRWTELLESGGST